MRRFWGFAGLLGVCALLGVVIWKYATRKIEPIDAKEPVDATISERYQDVGKLAILKLAGVMGTHEEDPSFGHTFAYSKDLKHAMSASGGYNPFAGIVEDGSLIFWKVDSGRVVRDWKLPKSGVSALALSNDGKRALLGLVSAGDKGEAITELAVFDTTTGKKEHIIRVFKTFIASVAISADGQRGLSGSQDGELRYWNLDKGKEIQTLAKPNNMGLGIMTLAFTPNGKSALSASGDDGGPKRNLVTVWDLPAGKAVRELTGHPGAVLSFAFSSDGKRMATGGVGGAVKVWDLAAGKELKQLTKDVKDNFQFDVASSVALSDDGKHVLAARGYTEPSGNRDDGTVTLWDADSGKDLWTTKARCKGLTPIAFVDGKKALTGGGANFFAHFDLADGKESKLWGGHKGAVNAVAIDAKGRIISAGQDRTLKVWDAEGRELKTIQGHQEAINALVLIEGGKKALSAAADKTLKLWDISSGKDLGTFKGTPHSANVTCLAVSPDGKLAASGSADRTIKLWDIASGKEMQTLTGHADNINAIAFDPKGQWLASGSDDNTVRLWPLKDNKQEGEFRILDGHKRQVTALAFQADGKQLLSGGQDQTLKLWDVSAGKVLQTLEGHKNWINALAISGNRAVSTSDDLSARLWDLTTGKAIEILDLGNSTDCPRCVAFSTTGDSFVIGTTGWVVLRLELKKK